MISQKTCTSIVLAQFPFLTFPGSYSAALLRRSRRRKARTVFSDQQLTGLELRFQRQRYLSTPERIELASLLGLSETQVRLVCSNFSVTVP